VKSPKSRTEKKPSSTFSKGVKFAALLAVAAP
jgi:hypothetical protein